MIPIPFLRDVTDMIFPRLCAACQYPLLAHERVICLRCRIALPRTDHGLFPDNPVAKKFWGKVPVETAFAMFYFHKGARVQHMMHALKYKNRKDVGLALGNMLGYYIRQYGLLTEIDGITVVPLHPDKIKKRGYNQSSIIGKGLSDVLHVPLEDTLLERVVSTATQTRKSRLERWDNVRSVFQVRTPIANKHYLLIDDVITTGSTLEACALQLTACENVRVSIAAVATADH